MDSWIWYSVVLIALLALVYFLSARTNLLRNSVFDTNSFNSLAIGQFIRDPKPGYSWSRVQFAFWTIIIVGSAIYVWLLKCGCSTNKISMEIDPVNLGLLGIAIGTTTVGKVIDTSQSNQPAAATTSAQQNQPSQGFFIDILSDETGVSIHRLQNVLWTAVIGYIYISQVYKTCAIPGSTVISPTMIALMGLSSAGYLGVKTTENQITPGSGIAVQQFTPPAPVAPVASPAQVMQPTPPNPLVSPVPPAVPDSPAK